MNRPDGGREERDTVLARLKRAGLRPRKGLGQHFLHDPRILAAIAEAAELTSSDAVLEVGTGPGTLTREIAARAGRVLTVDLDLAMLDFAREELGEDTRVEFLHGDALDGHGGLNPALRAAVEGLGGFKLVANLPYGIATPLLLAVISSGLPLKLAVATIQEELAERLSAAPGTGDYGPASALIRYFGRMERLRRLPAGAFWPPPKVSSQVVRYRPLREPIAARALYEPYRAWVHRLFSKRRKQLGGLLREALGEAEAEKALGLLGLAPTARPEDVPPEGFARLAASYPGV